jgi:Probable lipoprotein LpqN
MIEIAVPWRVFVGGFAAGAIGLAAFGGGTAAADPMIPAPGPVPAVPALAPQNPAGAVTNRFVPTPPSANPFAPPSLAAAPAAAPGVAAFAPTPPAANPFAPPSLAAAAPVAAPGVGAGAPTPPAPTPAASGTLREYLQSKGVKLEPQRPEGFKALDITLPVPARWTQVPDPNVPDAFAVIADRHGASVYTSNAQVVVYKLVGNVDPKEAITHGYVDSQKLLGWQATNASMADFGGFPSSVVEGTYREGDVALNTSRRHVIATSGHDKYLVSLSVTTDRAVAISDAPATDAIVNGFRVAVPGAPAPAPVANPAPVAAPAPVANPVPAAAPAPVGLPVQTRAAAPAGLPAQAAVPNQMAAPQPAPNLLALVPGLPPLPNFTSITGR